MRGKAPFTHIRTNVRRITPAHAGKRHKGHNLSSQCQDHPRPCGEKQSNHQKCYFVPGSPPPMRGKVSRCPLRAPCIGITPAHAGKRHSSILYASVSADHPRPCGEKTGLYGEAYRETGSPPPMRGKDVHGKRQKKLWRITPAHAGKSSTCPSTLLIKQDHPRPCGEKPRSWY